MNGAEVVYRASLPAPRTENDVFEISNRARALENNMYVVAPNIGGHHLFPRERDTDRRRQRPVDDRRKAP
jgi:beta-ureidopropionase